MRFVPEARLSSRAPRMAILPSRDNVIVAFPQPRLRVAFRRDGRERRFFIPPTYDYADDITVRETIDQSLALDGFRRWLRRRGA